MTSQPNADWFPRLPARAGWRTIVARDAETAIAMLGTQDGMMLDAILIDQWVPGADSARVDRRTEVPPPRFASIVADCRGVKRQRD